MRRSGILAAYALAVLAAAQPVQATVRPHEEEPMPEGKPGEENRQQRRARERRLRKDQPA